MFNTVKMLVFVDLKHQSHKKQAKCKNEIS